MKRGDYVAVCYDGKWGRRTKGIVTKTHRGHHITVRFNLYPEFTEEVEAKFRALEGWKPRKRYFGGFVRHENAFMPLLFNAFRMRDIPGDWYSVLKWRDAL